MVDGTEQRERRPAALDGDYFRVDETPPAVLAAMGEGLASHLRMHDEQGGSTGTWAALFDADELLLMATVSAYDAAGLQAALFDDFEATPEHRLAQGVLQLAAVLDGWYRRLHAIDADGARAVAGTIALLVQGQLADDMLWLRDHYASPGWQGELKGYSHQRLDPMWLQPGKGGRGRTDRSRREVLRSIFFALADAVGRVQETARKRLPASRTSQRHDPAAGLLAAFMELFQGVQRHINGFTARHTQFYYQDVLAMQPRAAQPDRVHLVCEPVPATGVEVVVPRGTLFAAGKDEQQRPIEFVSETELAVSDLKVAALRTLRLERAPLVLGQDRFDCVERILADAPGAAQPAPGTAAPYWPLFGGTQGQGAASAALAQLGLAVASPVLWLREGHRDIRITLALRNTAAGGGLWGRMADGDSQVQWQFVRALPQLFRVGLSSAAGWWEAPDCFVARRPPAPGTQGLDSLEITIRLRPEDPPIVGCVPALHGDGWRTTLPLARILVRQDAAMCAYSLLETAVLEQVDVQARVRGARDLVLGNQLGRLDPSTPFMPFGPLPQPGAYLVFGSAEAASKPLRRLRLNLQWSGLPRGLGGFAEHYAGYDTAFDDLCFKAKTGVLQEGLWHASAAQPDGQPMFRLGSGGRLVPTSQVVIDSADLQAWFRPAPPGAEPLAYGVGSRNGFFRWELREPAAGFGHAEYARVLTRVVSANARRKKPLPLPLPPYTPTVERVTLDYDAQASIRLGHGARGADAAPGAVFHIHPWGLERIHPAPPAARGVLPAWQDDGNLYIGLSGSDAQGTISLLFELRGESAVPLLHRNARIRWAYLAGDSWHEMPTTRVLADGTCGFLTSGIVTLDLPAQMDKDHTVMPPGLFWLRLSASGDYPSFAGLYSVRAQAISAVRSPASALPQAYEVLPAGSVSGPLHSIPGLARVVQVGPSFGMRPAESAQQLQVRAGERLKHKNRAVLPWDYERLVLERFPSVFKVRCFPNLRAPDAAASPGDVLVVLVPVLGGEEQRKDLPGPRLNAIELEQVEQYLLAHAPPQARITVRNASYERIQVRCSVAWRRGSNAGYCERRLSQELFEFLSPWNDHGYRARFGWTLRREDIEAYIRTLEDVAYVGGLSLLHVAGSDLDVYSLDDTARPRGAAQWDAVQTVAEGLSHARSRWPWSIAVPMRQHLVHTLEQPQSGGPVPTGVGRLAIGRTFVVGGQAA